MHTFPCNTYILFNTHTHACTPTSIHTHTILMHTLVLQAFGTGALEEEEDEDIFAEESVAAYHASIAQEGDVAVEMKFGWTGVDAD